MKILKRITAFAVALLLPLSCAVSALHLSPFKEKVYGSSVSDYLINAVTESVTIENPAGLGTTTLFKGDSVIADGTVEDKNVNFNIYGKDVSGIGSINVSSVGNYVQENLIGHYDSKNNTGSGYSSSAAQWTDLSGNNNHGILGSAVSWTTDGLQMVNSTLSYVTIPLYNPTYVTLEWVGVDNKDVNSEIDYLTNYNSGGCGISRASTGNVINGAFYVGGTYQRVGGIAKILNEKAHFATTYDGYAARFYKNGELIDTQAFSGKIVSQATTPFMLGGAPNASGGSRGCALVGMTYAARIYERALTSDEILQNYEVDKERFNMITTTASREITIGASYDNALRGVEVFGDDYTYIDSDNKKWVADYIEISQEQGAEQVILHRNIDSSGNIILVHAPGDTVDISSTPDGIALLGLKTAAFSTSLIARTVVGGAGVWMDGIVGPIIAYNYSISYTGLGSITCDEAIQTISLLDLDDDIVVDFDGTKVGSVSWRSGSIFLYAASVDSVSTTSLSVIDLLFYPDILKNLTEAGAGVYTIPLQLELTAKSLVTISVNNNPNMQAKIGGVVKTSANLVSEDEISIEVVFDSAIYESIIYSVSTGIDGTDCIKGEIDYTVLSKDYTASEISIQVINSVTISYELVFREYDVQILGKTTNGFDINFEGMVKPTSFSEKISYVPDDVTSIATEDLKVKTEHLESDAGVMILYKFIGFECNGNNLGTNIEINETALRDNARTGGDFIIYAIYQKKFVVNVAFNNPDATLNISDYGLFVGDGTQSKDYGADINFNGYAVDEGETIVLSIKPNIRYEVDSITGDDSTGRMITVSDREVYFVLLMDRSFDIAVILKNSTIRVDFYIDIYNNDSRKMVTAVYISDGVTPDSAYTEVSVDDSSSKTLTINEAELASLNYRAKSLMIYNFEEKKYEVLVDGILDAKRAGFFENYVSADGECHVVLFVVKQYLVDLNTNGFDYDNLVFTSELGSYAVKFTGGVAESRNDGTFMVDYNTTLTVESEVANRHYRFLGLYGVEDSGNDALITLAVDSPKYISANFEKISYNFNFTSESKNGVLETTVLDASIGAKVSLSFSPNGVYAVTGWKVAGLTLGELKVLCPDATLSGGTISFTVTKEFLDSSNVNIVGTGIEIDNDISTKLTATFVGALSGGGAIFVIALILILWLVLRSSKLKREKIAREIEINNIKRRFNVSEELNALREGREVPQSPKKSTTK